VCYSDDPVPGTVDDPWHMSRIEVLECIRDDAALGDLPVVVFTGKELSPEEVVRLHTVARSEAVKGVESSERLLDESALFLRRVVADLPLEKQHMLERRHNSDDDLMGKKVLMLDDDMRAIFALSSVLQRRGMAVLTTRTGRGAIASSAQMPVPRITSRSRSTLSNCWQPCACGYIHIHDCGTAFTVTFPYDFEHVTGEVGASHPGTPSGR
jgi:hypothetical protein